MLASILDDLALDPVKRLLQARPRMSDAIVLLFVGSGALLVWATGKRRQAKALRETWLDAEETCRYLGCGERFPRRQMRRVFTLPDGGWEWMCPRCFRAFGGQHRSEEP